MMLQSQDESKGLAALRVSSLITCELSPSGLDSGGGDNVGAQGSSFTESLCTAELHLKSDIRTPLENERGHPSELVCLE